MEMELILEYATEHQLGELASACARHLRRERRFRPARALPGGSSTGWVVLGWLYESAERGEICEQRVWRELGPALIDTFNEAFAADPVARALFRQLAGEWRREAVLAELRPAVRRDGSLRSKSGRYLERAKDRFFDLYPRDEPDSESPDRLLLKSILKSCLRRGRLEPGDALTVTSDRERAELNRQRVSDLIQRLRKVVPMPSLLGRLAADELAVSALQADVGVGGPDDDVPMSAAAGPNPGAPAGAARKGAATSEAAALNGDSAETLSASDMWNVFDRSMAAGSTLESRSAEWQAIYEARDPEVRRYLDARKRRNSTA